MRRALRWLLGLLVLLGVLALAANWLMGREETLRWAVQRLDQALPGKLSIEGLRGTLGGGAQFDRLVYEDTAQRVIAARGSLRWQAALRERSIRIGRADIELLRIESLRVDDKPPAEPESLVLPFELAIDDLRIARLEVVRPEAPVLRMNSLRATVEYAHEIWSIREAGVHIPWGNIVADVRLDARLDAKAPFRTEATVVAILQAGTSGAPMLPAMPALRSARIPVNLRGPLADLLLDSAFVIDRQQGMASARLRPFQNEPLDRAEVRMQGVSPKTFNPAWPAAVLDVRLKLDSGGPKRLAGTLSVVNHAPGRLDVQAIPARALSFGFGGPAEALMFSDIRVDLATTGRINGSGSLRGGQPDLALRALDVDLRSLHGRLIETRLNGPITLKRTDGAARDSEIIVLATLADGARRISLSARQRGDTVIVDEARLNTGSGRAVARGSIALNDPKAFRLSGEIMQFRPEQFGNFPAANLNGQFALEGALAPAIRVRGDVTLAPSRFLGKPLNGRASGQWTPAGLIDMDMNLAVGANQWRATGNFGRPEDRLVWAIDAPRLADLGPDFAGQAKANGTLSGSFSTPALVFDLRADKLVLFEKHRIEFIQGRGRIDTRAGGTMNANLSVNAYRGPAAQFDQALARIEGSAGQHRLTLAAQGGGYQVEALAAGGISGEADNRRWQGRLERLESGGRLAVRLLEPAALTLATGVADLRSARLSFNEGRVEIDRLYWDKGHLTSSGRATALPVPAALLKGSATALESTLRLNGEWDFNVAETANGNMRLSRQSGDLRFLSEPRLALELEQLDGRIDVRDGRVEAQLDARGRGLGQIRARAETALARSGQGWTLRGNAPLSLAARIDVPSLRWLGRLSGMTGFNLDGALRAEVNGSGTIARPLLSGNASGSAVTLRWTEHGIDYRNGKLEARFEGDRIILQNLAIEAGAGSATASGEVRLADGQPDGEIKLHFNRFTAMARPDRLLVVSGESAVRLANNRATVTGRLIADRGLLQLAGASGITQSSDVVIVGAPARIERGRVPLQLSVNLNLGFGENFRVSGSGLEGRLAGQLQVIASGGDTPRAVGSLRVVDGIYTAWGQRLTLVRGVLNFSGPISNPGINFLAVRRGTAVEAGVEVRGSALAPEARLVSTPLVPDTEKLSWLVLGRGLEGGGPADFALLSAAAAGLIGSGGGPSLQGQLAGALSLDELRFGAAAEGPGGILTLGKRISSQLYLSYEQGFGTVANVLKVRYDLSQRWAVEFRTGTENAFDVLYTLRFD